VCINNFRLAFLQCYSQPLWRQSVVATSSFDGSSFNGGLIMYCPRCGAQAADTGTFCRNCGTSLSIITEALAGKLVPAVEAASGSEGPKKPRTMVEGISALARGLGFAAVGLAVLHFGPAGEFWWYWMLIPAFTSMGSGIAMIAEVKSRSKGAARSRSQVDAARSTGALPEAEAQGISPPPSVVEATTRRLDRSRQDAN
jgi:hypothetical protein